MSVLLCACSASPPPLSDAERSSSSAAAAAAVAAEAAAANSILYGTSGPPTMTAPPTTSAATSATGEFTRTWTKDYAKTTCTEFRTVMTGQQAFVAAADMLVNARQATDPSWPMPSDDLINTFEGDLNTICSTGVIADNESITTVAGSVLMVDANRRYLK